ncbi:Transcription factor iws1 [Xylographa trunciseda]|nr:Transcription factor iws1 [Xylographa trunciseda]
MSSESESIPASPLPEAGNDPSDPNELPYQDHDPPSAPIGDPTADMDALSDNESVLSDIDEAQFEDFDPANVAIDERPAIAVDEDTVKLLGRHKRKRDLGDGVAGGEGGKRKRKEGKREKPKKSRKKRDEDDNFSGGEELEGKRARKKKAIAEGGEKREKPRPRPATPENEEKLDPVERRRRALDRAMDNALKNPNKRRRRADGIDVNSMADEEIASLRQRMADAAERDVQARSADPPRPAMHKLRLLPEVVALLNRNGREIENAIVDPENNLLESVRFFLEPLNDGSLPAYNIQRELFACLAKLPIGKDSLVSSGIGKVVLFYTKSKKPELGIKRQAERLLGEWTRPILKRSDDYRKRVLEEIDYDPSRLPLRPSSQAHGSRIGVAETAAQIRERALAPPVKTSNRARMETNLTSYSIVPKSSSVAGGVNSRPMGASGEDAFRKMKARQMVAMGKGPKR